MGFVLLLLSAAMLAAVLARRVVVEGAASERWFLAVAGALLLTAIISLLLARLGCHAPIAVATALGAGALGLHFATREVDRVAEPPWPRWSGWEMALLVVVAGSTLLYAAFPTYSLDAGRDPGAYLLFAHRIARTGGLEFEQALLAELPPAVGTVARHSYAALYSASDRGISNDVRRLVPQFMHLYPALAANAAALGVEGIVRVNAVVMGIGLWGLGAFTARAVNRRAAMAVVLALGINPAVLWSARITLTEPLAMLIFVLGACLLLRAHQERSRRSLLLGAVVLSLGVLCRLDGTLNVLPVTAAALAWSVRPGAGRAGGWAVVLFAVVCALGWLDAWEWSRPYVYDNYVRGRVGKLLALAGGCTAVGIAAAWWAPAKLRGASAERLWGGAAVAAAVATSVWMAYGYFLRSRTADTFDARSMRELGWYVTPAAFAAAGIGAVLLARSKQRLAWLPFLAATLFSIFVFTWRPSVSWDHIWASRRWVPYTIPGIIVLSVASVSTLLQTVPRSARPVIAAGALTLAAQYAVAAIDFASPFLTRSMHSRMPGDYDALVAAIRRAQPTPGVLTDSNLTASILAFMYGIPTVRVARSPSRWHPDARRAAAGFGFLTEHPVRDWGPPVARMGFGGPVLERTAGVPPQELVDRPWEVFFWIVPSTGSSRPGMPERFRASRLWSKVGERSPNRTGLRTTAVAGDLQYGPYVEVDAGWYVVTWLGTVTAPGRGRVDVASSQGQRIHATQAVEFRVDEEGGAITTIEFALAEPVRDLEFRMSVDDEVELTLLEVQLAEVRRAP